MVPPLSDRGRLRVFGERDGISHTYREWVHHYQSPKIPRKMAFEAAIKTFILLMVVALAGGFFVVHYLSAGR